MMSEEQPLIDFSQIPEYEMKALCRTPVSYTHLDVYKRQILEEDPTDKDFISQYRQRKDLLN